MRCSRSARPWPLLLALAGAGCASLPAPKEWLPTRGELSQTTRGAWAVVYSRAGATQAPTVQGELIAVDETQVRVLTRQGLVAVPEARIAKLRLQVFAPDRGVATAWMLLGTLSTLSHGGYLIITAPAWILTGVGATSAETGSALLEHPPRPLAELRPFARFPQGCPEGLTDAELGPLELRPEERPTRTGPR